VDALGGVIDDVRQQVCEPGLRIDVVEFGSADQGIDRGGALAATVGAGKQPSFAPEGNAAHRARSAALLVRQMRPSSRNRVKVGQRFSMYNRPPRVVVVKGLPVTLSSIPRATLALAKLLC
jgi:hypothetical protein